ncbi:MAG: prephenate dehydrogenase/arogenate dehydrogenase family protein [Gammaproteobacteria bacterium]
MTQLTIIGLGLIGGSIALALKQRSFSGRILAYDAHSESLQTAIASKCIDEATTDIGVAVQKADYIIIAVPLTAYKTIFRAIRSHLQPHTIITDVGSVKTSVIDLAQQELGDAFPRFVPGHPIAGIEKSGISAASADLFQDKLVILNPTPLTNAQAVTGIKQLWEKTGAQVEQMDASVHDKMLAATSHLPQMLAYTYLQTLLPHKDFPQLLKYAGSGFKDFTRIAASNPALWVGIALNNRDALLQELKQFRQHLDELANILTAGNDSALQSFFSTAKLAREQFDSLTTQPTK